MGRRKIDIEFIREDRSRATTFIKRKSGLFKKAHELAVLTGAQVAVVVFSQQDKVFTYSNEPCSEICTKFLESKDINESKGPHDYSANQDNDDDSEDEVETSAIISTTNRKTSISGHARSDSGSSHKIVITSPKGHSRKDSTAQSISSLSSPKLEPKRNDNGRRSPSISSNKRGSPPSYTNSKHSSPKFPKHEHMPRELSDVRSSPHQPVRSRASSVMKSTPPMMHDPEFSQAQIPQTQSMLHPQQQQQQQQYIQQAAMMSGPMYVPQQQQHHIHQQHSQQQGQSHDRNQYQQEEKQVSISNTQQRPDYSVPTYGPPPSSTRQLPMAPPLTIPANPYPNQSSHSQAAQPLLPPGTGHAGNSRVLLPGEGNIMSTSLTPTESPSNFASSLYANSGISGIATNISIPRISTDVGSLFYNWNTNEPGLSPATSMMLNQFRDGDATNGALVNGSGTGNGTANANGSHSRGPSSGHTSGGISAGVLENFSPVTAQWLSGQAIPLVQPPVDAKPQN